MVLCIMKKGKAIIRLAKKFKMAAPDGPWVTLQCQTVSAIELQLYREKTTVNFVNVKSNFCMCPIFFSRILYVILLKYNNSIFYTAPVGESNNK